MKKEKEKENLIVKMIPTSELKISEFNVRKEHDDTDKISELAKSIQEEGILQPLLVRPENGNYGIIIGSRRYSAAKKIHLKEMPVTIRELGDTESLVISLIENLQRNDLEPKETTKAMATLNQTISLRELATKLGKSPSYVSDMVTVVQLLHKLDQSGVTVEMHPEEKDRTKEKAIPLYHTVFVAEAFKSPELKPLLAENPNKDLEVAKAVIHSTHEDVKKIMKEYRKHPEDDIERIVARADMGLLDEDSSGGHAVDFKGGRGSDDIDIRHYEFQINYHCSNLCHYLTNISEMPEPTDDVEVDFIRKSRDFRKMLVSELEPMNRAGIHKRLNYLSALIEETMEEIEKADKK